MMNPAITLRSVVLPHPEGPTMHINSPRLTERVTSETAPSSPFLTLKVTLTFLSSRSESSGNVLLSISTVPALSPDRRD